MRLFIAEKPNLAKAIANGKPTYPKPTTAKGTARERKRSAIVSISSRLFISI